MLWLLSHASRPVSYSPKPQGIKWVTNREGPNGLVVLQQGQPKYVDKVLAAIEQVGGLKGA
jgi:dynein heavy chain, axonemal